MTEAAGEVGTGTVGPESQGWDLRAVPEVPSGEKPVGTTGDLELALTNGVTREGRGSPKHWLTSSAASRSTRVTLAPLSPYRSDEVC